MTMGNSKGFDGFADGFIKTALHKNYVKLEVCIIKYASVVTKEAV